MQFLLTLGPEPWMIFTFYIAILLIVVLAFYGRRMRKIKYQRLRMEDMEQRNNEWRAEKSEWAKERAFLKDEIARLTQEKTPASQESLERLKELLS